MPLVLRPATSLPFKSRQWLALGSIRYFASTRKATISSEEDIQAARKWLEKLHAETIPKNIGELSFSRSSGPGGQNVNKYVCSYLKLVPD
jgi:peptidyl-tRNA hydrolase ICT1